MNPSTSSRRSFVCIYVKVASIYLAILKENSGDTTNLYLREVSDYFINAKSVFLKTLTQK